MKRYCLDTNVLVLLLVGKAHPDWLGRKPVSEFDQDDLRNLERILDDAKGFVTLPYILAETSNFLFGKRSSSSPLVSGAFRNFMSVTEELPVSSHELTLSDDWQPLGLTDYAILSLIRDGAVVVTVDFALTGQLEFLGVPVINLRHKRII